ncbi:DUF3179 domain-containing protein [Pseudooceanicola sp.]|uniref:DUF3179 domain-containing protein n=1 Tax=Pseudooceanicola sp. TaxID=1914328 RepID=UPI0040593C3F
MKLKHLLLAVPLVALTLAPILGAAQNPFHAKSWPKTDFGAFLVDPGMIFSGGPGKDEIPSIDTPRMLNAAAETRLDPQEPVVTVALPGETARAYPLRYLLWHEVVNDRIGDMPIAVTYGALYDSAVVYERHLTDGARPDFGVSGLLRHADTLLFDRETESWWQQASGRAIVGQYAGEMLRPLPTWVESWEAYRRDHPGGLVMSEPVEWERAYGTTPLAGYENAPVPPLYVGPETPPGIAPLSRVVRVGDKAWPLTRLMAEGRIAEAGVLLTWTPGMRSVHDTVGLSMARDIGMVRVHDPAGYPVPHDMMFAFGFHALWPGGQWMTAGCSDLAPGQPC